MYDVFNERITDKESSVLTSVFRRTTCTNLGTRRKNLSDKNEVSFFIFISSFISITKKKNTDATLKRRTLTNNRVKDKDLL